MPLAAIAATALGASATTAAVVGGVASLAGAAAQSNSAKKAAQAQANAASSADALQKYQYEQTREDNMPALDARNASLDRMRELLGISDNKGAAGFGSLGGAIDTGDVTTDPGYQFGLSEGLKAQGNMLGARGMRNSGAAIKAATRYGTDYATTKYDNAFNRVVANRSAQLNPLQSLAGLGQTGASTVANAGQNYASTVGGNRIGVGNAQAVNSLAQGNIWGGAVNELGSAAKGWFNNTGSSYVGNAGAGDYTDPNFLNSIKILY